MSNIMPHIQHPNAETLTAYLESPGEKKYSDLRLHLASCKTCRGQIEQLHNIQQGIQRHLATIMASTSINNNKTVATFDNSIEQYIDSHLPEAEQNRVESIIKENPNALKAALHYATHSRAMRRQMGQLDARQNQVTSKQRTNAKQTTISDWLNSLFNWNPSTWMTVPVTAAIVFAVTFLLMPQSDNDLTRKFTIASYQDNPVIRFRDSNAAAPGIGFFGTAKQTKQPFSNIEIAINQENKLTLRWPAISNSSKYTVDLFVMSDGAKIAIAQINSNIPQVVFESHEIQLNQRYEWKISGITDENKFFSTIGGLVITPSKSKGRSLR